MFDNRLSKHFSAFPVRQDLLSINRNKPHTEKINNKGNVGQARACVCTCTCACVHVLLFGTCMGDAPQTKHLPARQIYVLAFVWEDSVL